MKMIIFERLKMPKKIHLLFVHTFSISKELEDLKDIPIFYFPLIEQNLKSLMIVKLIVYFRVDFLLFHFLNH